MKAKNPRDKPVCRSRMDAAMLDVVDGDGGSDDVAARCSTEERSARGGLTLLKFADTKKKRVSGIQLESIWPTRAPPHPRLRSFPPREMCRLLGVLTD